MEGNEIYTKEGMEEEFVEKTNSIVEGGTVKEGAHKVYTKEGADETFITKDEASELVPKAFEMNLKDMKVSPDEFKYYTGIDLDFRLVEKNMSEGNSSNASRMFIERIQRQLNVYIDTHFRGGIGSMYERPTESQKFYYKMAVIEQVKYIFDNEDVTDDMGLDENGRPRLSRADVYSREISVQCRRNLEMAGLWNRRLFSGGFGWCWWRI